MTQDFIKPILSLSLICLFMSALLGLGNGATQPVIQAAAAQRAEEARKEALPQAEAYIQMDIDGLPAMVTEVYGTTNDVGYIFMVTSAGYGGDIKLVCSIGTDGRIVRTMTLAQSETKGIATPVFETESQYIGQDKDLAGVDAVSGATISSRAYKNGILAAFAAYEILTGGSVQ